MDSALDHARLSNPSNDLPRAALYALAGWVALALVIAASGVLREAVLLIALLVFGAVAGPIIAWRRSPALRAWTAGLDLRAPILLHVVRIGFGTLFLVELAAGRLPATFAERGGYGDIIAGVLAIVAAFAAGRPHPRQAQPATRMRRGVVYAFTFFGLADILAVFATAQVLILVEHDPLMLGALGQLPYSLLPTVVVPAVILSHLLTLQRLFASRAR